MSDVDALLQQAGERWREGQAAPPEIDRTTFKARATAGSVWPLRGLAIAGAAVLLLVGLAVSQGFWTHRVGGQRTCAVTIPVRPFVPAPPAAPVPPARYHANWYGSDGLWAMLDRDGEVWAIGATGLRQKTFWWSGAWSPGDEPIPAITVIGVRLDGAGTFESGPGTNASADFGTAMLVGVEFPAPGCWRLTAAYRDVELSYVVLVTDE